MKMNDLSSRFLRWAFGDQRGRVMVVSFKGVPRDVPGYAWHAERADALASGGQWPPAVENNNYFCVSLFKGSRRQDVDFESLHVLAIDDVGVKVDPGVLLDRLGPPGWAWETSPGNQQWFYRLREWVVDEKLARLLVLMVRRSGDTTASQDGKLLTRLMRLPSGTNGKEDYLPDGYPTAVVFEPEVGDQDVGTLDDPAGVLASWDAAEVACGGVATADLPAAARSSISSGGLGKRVGKSVLDLIGDDPVGKKLLELGFVRGLIPSGLGVEVVCPWEDEHTVKSGTGAAYFPEKGGFECHHGHCQGRGYKELVGWLEDYLDQWGVWEGGVFGDLFGVVRDDPDDPPLYREVIVDRYVFIEAENRYLDRWALVLIPVEAFNASHRKGLLPWLGYMAGKVVKTLTPHAWFVGSGGGRVATTQTYWPGRGAVFTHKKRVLANLWQPSERPVLGAQDVDEQDVEPWIELVELICAGEGPTAALWVLDWFALMVGAPDIKPGWGLIVQSAVHGIGKDMMLWPVLEAIGERNVASPTAAQISSGFNEFAEKRMVSVTDLERNTRGATTAHDIYEAIKPWTENTSRMVEIVKKYQRPYRALNVSGWVITSNAGDAMPLAESDRRFLVIMSRMQPRGDAYYRDLKAWLNANWPLVGEFLHRRWASMPQDRRDMLLGHPPGTPGKKAMTLAAEDKLTAWTREQIEDGIWSDLMTSRDVQDAYERASRRVLNNVPTGHKMGANITAVRRRIIAKWGNGSIAERSAVTRMWAVRCPERYRQMDHNELTDTYMQQNGQFSPLLI